jgi:FkbM family methyltransferase
MKIHYNSRNVLFKELDGDQYGLKALPQNSIKHFIDIGAAYGMMSIMARLLHPEMKITAIEPHPETYKDLCFNVERLKIGTINGALGNGSKFFLQKERKMRLCNSFLQEKKDDNTEVQSYSLIQLIALCKYDPSDLAIKMDCEGAEWYMINQDEEILKGIKLIGIEVHNDILNFYSWMTKQLGRTHEITVHNYSDTLGIIRAVKV